LCDFEPLLALALPGGPGSNTDDHEGWDWMPPKS
jgi:hypothetical protein